MSTVGKTAGAILYGLLAGFAATTVAILGPLLLAWFFVWVFSSLGWQQARDAAVTVISLYVFITGFGILLGVFVCLRVCITRLRGAPVPPASPR